MRKEDIQYQMGQMAIIVKIVCGVANNCAWLACLEAHDKLKKHPRYRHACKKAYKAALEEFHRYERELVYGFRNAMFSIDNLPAGTREKFRDITDREYYELWAACGATAYNHTKPLLTSLVNKYRLALTHIGSEHPDIYAWALAGQICLELAVTVHNEAVWPTPPSIHLREQVVRAVFAKFSLRKVKTKWYKAIQLTEPDTFSRDFSAADDKNIQLGIDQLLDAWTDAQTIFAAALEATRSSDEMFRTKGDMKAVLREIGELGRHVIAEAT